MWGFKAPARNYLLVWVDGTAQFNLNLPSSMKSADRCVQLPIRLVNEYSYYITSLNQLCSDSRI